MMRTPDMVVKACLIDHMMTSNYRYRGGDFIQVGVGTLNKRVGRGKFNKTKSFTFKVVRNRKPIANFKISQHYFKNVFSPDVRALKVGTEQAKRRILTPLLKK